jgi:hypothetical protein
VGDTRNAHGFYVDVDFGLRIQILRKMRIIWEVNHNIDLRQIDCEDGG